MRRVRFSGFLKLINTLIVLVLIAALAAIWWFGYRPLPQTSGTMRAPVSQKISVARDDRGIPHIQAAAIPDVLFAQGFATAQDRMWQMETLRRAATGTLSEIAGAATLEADRDVRKLRLARLAEIQMEKITPEDRAILGAYAHGVNHYINSQRGNYPAEFRLVGVDPKPWRIEDTLAIGLLMFRTLSNDWRFEVQKAAMLQRGDREKVNRLFSPRAGTDVQPGSNGWAIHGSRTASGQPILANDMHLEHSLPGIWHAVWLEAEDLNVFGVTVPGVPCVVVGRNQRIAWGITNLGFDVQDLYLEQLDANTGKYLFKGQLLQAELERELIPVKGQAPVEFQQWVTVHGPVITTVGNRHAALRWTAATPVGFRFAPLAINRARNWQEFRAALNGFPGASSNFVYADVEGNIGMQVTGRLPVRKAHDGDVPVEGSGGEFEWETFIPYEELPSFFNPARGYVATSNQNPFPPDYRYRVSGNFAPPYRASQIDARLQANRKWTAADSIRLQADVYSPFLHRLARHLVGAGKAKGASGPVQSALNLLSTWNGQMVPDKAAPLLARDAFVQLRRMVATRAANAPEATYAFQMGTAAIEDLIDERPAGWFKDWDVTLLEALELAIGEETRSQGNDLTRWRYGIANRITIRNPVLQRLPWLGNRFNIGPFEADGGSTTPKQTTARLLPSMRMAADFGDPAGGLFNLLTGESGHALSSHYRDQWPAFQAATSFPLYGTPDETLLIEIEPSQ